MINHNYLLLNLKKKKKKILKDANTEQGISESKFDHLIALVHDLWALEKLLYVILKQVIRFCCIILHLIFWCITLMIVRKEILNCNSSESIQFQIGNSCIILLLTFNLFFVAILHDFTLKIEIKIV